MLPEVHDGDPVGDLPDHRQVVRDEDVGQVEVALQVPQQVQDLRLDRDVERRDRLVADDQLRLTARARARRRSAGAGRRRTRAGSGCSAPGSGRRVSSSSCTRVFAPFGPVDRERRADDLADRLARVQRRVRILEDHLHLAPQRPQLRAGSDARCRVPSKRIVPAVGSSSRSIRRAVVDLPQPDSPTMPSVSPRRTRQR